MRNKQKFSEKQRKVKYHGIIFKHICLYGFAVIFIQLILLSSCSHSKTDDADVYVESPTNINNYSESVIIPEEEISSELSFDNINHSAESFKTVLEQANARHKAVVKPDEEQLAELTKNRVVDVSKIHAFHNDIKPVMDIPSDDAVADVEDLFNAMKACYGGYTYFGGDDGFEPIKQAIINEVNEHNVIQLKNFEAIIAQNLSEIISDNHFSIGRYQMSKNNRFFYIESEGFIKADDGFVNQKTGLRVESIEGYESDEVFRLHINNEGELIWNPVILKKDGENSGSTLSILYEDGSKESHRLYPYAASSQQPAASLDRSTGYPIVKLTRMEFDATEAGINGRNFLSYANELRDEPVVIVDIRGNPGGNGILPVKWLHMLTGEIVPTNYVGLRAIPFSNDDNNETNKNSPYYVTTEDLKLYMNSTAFLDDYTLMDIEPDRYIEREQLLILIVDSSTSSSAEGFVDLCFNVENTLIIGSNTGGVLNFDLTWPTMTLTRSGLHFGFGSVIFLHPEGHLVESVGILPDIWVAGDALKSTMAMLQQAGY